MKTVIFDIETVGCDFSQLDDFSREYFLKFSEAEEIEKVQDSLSFYPLTAQVVAIGMVDAETQKGAVYFQDNGRGLGKIKKGEVYFHACDERGILENFWRQIQRYDSFVTFNGRMFDCPFVMIRSAVHRLKIMRNLLPYRYSAVEHVDLADQLSFHGCLARKFPLHAWCRVFGIPSSKANGITGLQVKELFYRECYFDIAQYCLDDVMATRNLYLRWKESFTTS